jgi:excisionase family DNA binding protein
MIDQLLTVPEVASRLRMSSWGVYKMTQQNRLPVVRVGSRLRFSAKAIDDYLRHRTTGPRKVKETPVPELTSGTKRDALSN